MSQLDTFRHTYTQHRGTRDGPGYHSQGHGMEGAACMAMQAQGRCRQRGPSERRACSACCPGQHMHHVRTSACCYLANTFTHAHTRTHVGTMQALPHRDTAVKSLGQRVHPRAVEPQPQSMPLGKMPLSQVYVHSKHMCNTFKAYAQHNQSICATHSKHTPKQAGA